MLLQTIAVEVLTLQKAGRSLGDVCNPRGAVSIPWVVTSRASFRFDPHSEAVALDFRKTNDAKAILEAIPSLSSVTGRRRRSKAKVEEEAQAKATATGASHTRNEDPHTTQSETTVEPAIGSEDNNHQMPWMDLPLRDPSVKLAVRNLLQCTIA